MIVRDGPKKPRYPLALIHPLGPLFRHLPLSLRRHLLFLRAFGKWGNFRSPRTWREKMQWRILNDHRPLLAWTADKLAQKEFVRTVRVAAASEHIRIPETYWVGTDVRDLRKYAEGLPKRWVLKPNHSSGRVVLLDAAVEPVDWERLATRGDRWMQPDEETLVFGHWAYTEARPLLIAEERVGSGPLAPDDLRITFFHGLLTGGNWSHAYGTPNYRMSSYREDLTTRTDVGNPDDVGVGVATPLDSVPQEVKLRVIKETAAIGAPFDAMRVDGYLVDETLWFGELTTYSNSGLGFVPPDINRAVGALWQLPDLSAPDPREAEWRALLQGVPKGTLQA